LPDSTRVITVFGKNWQEFCTDHHSATRLNLCGERVLAGFHIMAVVNAEC